MILRALTLSATACLIAVGAQPARADVLEVGTSGEARWVAGPAMALAASQELSASYPMVPGIEQVPVQVPAEIDALVPETAVANTSLHDDGVPQQYAAKVAELAARFDLSPALIEALVWQESRWHANARSPVGAQGLAQLMPGTARYLGVDARDPFANLEGGARYLREQLDRFDGDLEKALAAYNAGPGRVMRAGGIPRIRETQQYVASIMGRLANHSRSSE